MLLKFDGHMSRPYLTRYVYGKSDFMQPELIYHSLYPLNEGPNVISKTLLPVGNVPIINYVLDWVLDSGLTGQSPFPVVSGSPFLWDS